MDAEELVQRQLEAYNKHDLEDFVQLYHEEVEVYNFPSMELRMKGRENLRAFYKEHRFQLPDLHSQVTKRIVLGNTVIDHEIITGLKAEPVEMVAIYETKDDFICKIWFIYS